MQTSPLAKAITTTEGVLAVVFNVALGVAAVPAIGAISPTVAGICAAVTNVALIGQRGLIKVKAIQADPFLTLGKPEPAPAPPREPNTVAKFDQTLRQVLDEPPVLDFRPADGEGLAADDAHQAVEV